MQEQDDFILSHLPLVRTIALRLRENLPACVELEDLIHAGILGLLEAAGKYDSGKQVLFSTYARYRIRGAMLDSLRRQDWASREHRRMLKELDQTVWRLPSILEGTEAAAPAEGRPDSISARAEMRAHLGRAMQGLPHRHRQVLELYYGDDLTMTEIGGVMGINQSRVWQIHKSALDRMAEALGIVGITSAAAFLGQAAWG